MRIGMFADMYKPHTSGVTNFIALYKKRFEELGHEVFVFTYGNRDHADDEPNVVRSPAIAWGSTGWQAGLAASREARDLMRTLDVAHVHHPFVSGRTALRYAKPAGVPVVFTNHTRYDLYSDAYAAFVPRALRMAYLRGYLSRFARDVDRVIAPSPGIVEWLRDFGITDNAVLLPNAVDTEPFAHPAAPRPRADFGFSPDSVVFCYLGRLGPEKNLGDLVEAFIRAAETDPRVCLMLIGDGPMRTQTLERVWAHGLADRVHFAGMVPYALVPDYLAACDAFATASVSEVHPLVVIEALAAGLPVIGVHSPGVGDIVTDGETGFLTHGDTSEFSARMLDLTRDDALRARMRVLARELARGEYDIRPSAERLLALYREVGATG